MKTAGKAILINLGVLLIFGGVAVIIFSVLVGNMNTEQKIAGAAAGGILAILGWLLLRKASGGVGQALLWLLALLIP